MGLCSSSLDDDAPAQHHYPHYHSQPTSTASTFPPTSSYHFSYPSFPPSSSSSSALRPPPPHLPTECIALILSHLPPATICRLASVSKAWAEAADSDTCWTRLLPRAFAPKLFPDCSSKVSLNPKVVLTPLSADSSPELILSSPASSASSPLPGVGNVTSRGLVAGSYPLASHLLKYDPLRPGSTNPGQLLPGPSNPASLASDPLKRPSSKVLFQALCQGVLLEGGRLQVKIDPGTGLVRAALSATEAMGIAWGSNASYWQQVELKGSVFPRVAHLAAVSTFDLIGRFTLPLPVRSCRYELWWRVARDPTLGETWMPRDVVFEWPTALVTSNVKVTGPGLSESVEIQRRVVFNDATLPGAGWTEVGVGVVVLWPGKKGGELVETEWEVRLHEVESGMWKSGLYVDCFLLREAPM
ncbi:hypothetical protein CLOP_g17038 [Closterium sp. NIES-67]|nr:hypothetical protein CLOP_g17038 [Closterium sp. NIES-67]